jgi:hypothetical protein
MNPLEPCPICHETSTLREKLLLVDAAWGPAPGKDPRLAYYADLRADDVRSEHAKASPLQQFVDGYFCERCGKGFVSEAVLSENRRRYRG